MKKLKPCPFCGGEAEEQWMITMDRRCFCYWCKSCNATLPFVSNKYQAIKTWNRRAEE